MKEHFLNLVGKYSSSKAYNLELWEEISKNYNSKKRYYHNLEHLKKMLNELEEVEGLVEDHDAILFSIYYHDIIYKVTKSDNELKSAEYFKERISKTKFASTEKCFLQIEATKTHQKSIENDTNILLDLDLSILGSQEAEYNEYAQNVRKEYKIYPDFLYNNGRKKVLLKMLDSSPIFKTAYFINKYEENAKRNLLKEIARL